MFDIGQQGGRRLKIPTICTIVAAAALAGLPPFSGFFSKEVILGALADLNNPVWLAAGLLGAFLTAYYTFRLIFIILFPKINSGSDPQSGHGHDHNGYWAMGWPLIILAIFTVVLGFCQGSLEAFFQGQQSIPAAQVGHHAWLPLVAIGSTLFGVVLAWLEFGRQGADQVGFVEKFAPLNKLFAERWYIDRFYRRFMDIFIYGVVSKLFTLNDKKVIDGGIDGLGKGTVETGRFVSFLHLGMIQYRLLTICVVLVLLGIYFFL